MRRRGNWWIGVAAGLTLGVAAIVTVDQAAEPASAQSAAGATFRVTPAQLQINQRISQAAVRRSNEGLRLLDPVRPLPNQPAKVLGWRTQDIRDGAVTSAKLDTAVREGQPRWAVVAAGSATLTRGKGVTAAAKLATTGFYTVTFDRDVTACAVQATIAAGDTTVTPVGQVSAWHTPDTPNAITVRTAQDDETTGVPEDSNALPFHATVLC
jgi:uncharacterized Zn-binding protein involved in type VI secretion